MSAARHQLAEASDPTIAKLTALDAPGRLDVALLMGVAYQMLQEEEFDSFEDCRAALEVIDHEWSLRWSPLVPAIESWR